MRTFSVLLLTVFALLFGGAPVADAARFVNLAPILDGTLIDAADNLNDGLFESVDIAGNSLRIQAGPATVDVSRIFLQFDISEFVDADQVLAASLVLTSAVTVGDPSSPLTHVVCLPGNCITDLALGFAAQSLGVFPFANGTFGVDVTGFIRGQIAAGGSSIGFLLRAHEQYERDWEQVQQFFRSSEFSDPAQRPRLALIVATPEPGSIVLMSSGLLLLGLAARRRRQRVQTK